MNRHGISQNPTAEESARLRELWRADDAKARADRAEYKRSDHVHGWRDVETVRVPRVKYSPVSHNDDYRYTAVILVQSCECGEFRKVTLAHEAPRADR